MRRVLFLFVALTLLVFSFSILQASETSGQLRFDTSGGAIIIGGGSCQEDWSSSFWSDCVDNEQTYICIQTNPSCDTENLKPALCGTTQACEVVVPPVVNNGNGGGSGGSNNNNGGSVIVTPLGTTSDFNEEACEENWACYEWSDNTNACGTRDCFDINECGTIELKPLTEKVCSQSGFSSLTGSVIGGISDFSKSKAGKPLLLGAILVVLALAIVGVKKRQGKGTKNSTEIFG